MDLDRPPSEFTGQPGSVLLLEPGAVGAADRLCGRLLAVDDPAGTGVVLVTLVQPPAARLAFREEFADGPPAETVVVTLDAVADAGGVPEGVDLWTVSAPGNLTRLGVVLTEALAAVEGTRPVLCFHSLSVLLQYADPDRVFRFLSVLKTHLDAAGAVAHFHLTPSSHDERTVEALRHLFDDVVSATD